MIRRDAGRGEYLLIAQTDHAAVAARLAEHFGGDDRRRFARPRQRDAVLAAARTHDDGWPLHDDAPTVDHRGRPLDVFDVPPGIALPVWAASADRAAVAGGPYAGLLVSLHSMSLSAHAASREAKKHEKFDTADAIVRFNVNKFQHREIERQDQLRRAMGWPTDLPLRLGLADAGASPAEDELRYGFHLLQAMDLLSLCLCCTHPPATHTDDLLPSPAAPATVLRMNRDGIGRLRVSPWPFDVRQIEFAIPAKRVPARKYADDAELRGFYAAATVETLNAVVMP